MSPIPLHDFTTESAHVWTFCSARVMRQNSRVWIIETEYARIWIGKGWWVLCYPYTLPEELNKLTTSRVIFDNYVALMG